MIQRIGFGLFILLVILLGFMQPGIKMWGMQVIGADLIFPLASLFILLGLIKSNFVFPPITFSILLLLYACLMGISAALSVSQFSSAVKMAGILYLVGLAFITAIVATDRIALKIIVVVWIATSAFVSMLACYAVLAFYVVGPEWAQPLLHHYGSLIPGNYPRIQSTFIYPAMLCNYLIAGTLLTLGAFKAGWIGDRTKNISLAMHIVAAVFTLTPGLGGFLAALALWVAYWFRKDKRIFVARGMAFAGVSLAFAAVLISAFSIFPIETSPYLFDLFGIRIDPTQRLLAWQDGFKTFLQFPFFGKGVGMPVASVLFKSPTGMQMLTDAHQTGISVLAQGGMFAFAGFAALVVYVLRMGRQLAVGFTEFDPIKLALWLALFSGLIIQGLVGSFEDSRHLWVLMGLIIATRKIATDEQIKTQTMPEVELHASHRPNASGVLPA